METLRRRPAAMPSGGLTSTPFPGQSHDERYSFAALCHRIWVRLDGGAIRWGDVRWGVRREQPMGGEELGRVVPHVRETQGRLANQRAEEVRALAVADALGAQPGEFRGEGPAPCASRLVVAFGGDVNFQGVPEPRRRRR